MGPAVARLQCSWSQGPLCPGCLDRSHSDHQSGVRATAWDPGAHRREAARPGHGVLASAASTPAWGEARQVPWTLLLPGPQRWRVVWRPGACALPHRRVCRFTAGRAKKETPMRVKVAASSLPFQVWGYLSP